MYLYVLDMPNYIMVFGVFVVGTKVIKLIAIKVDKYIIWLVYGRYC